MPLYEYNCPNCGRFETIRKFSDAPLTECPTCLEKGKKVAVERIVSASAFHLKGSGWYKTDYAAGSSSSGTGKPSTASESTEAKGDSSTSPETKSEPKNETKTETKTETKACGTGCGCH